MKITLTVQDNELSKDADASQKLVSSYLQALANLTAARKRSGLTQEEVAEKAGIWRTNLSRIENGESQALTPYTVKKLAKAYEIEDTMVPLMDSIVGLKMKNARLIQGYKSTREAAKASGVSHQRISELENGNLTNSKALDFYSKFLKVKV